MCPRNARTTTPQPEPPPEQTDPADRISGRTAAGVPGLLPVLPLRDTVMFPGTVMPLGVSRVASLKLLDDALPTSKVIGLLAQRQPSTEEPILEDLYPVGTAAVVLKLIRQEDRSVTLLVHGLSRFQVTDAEQEQPYLRLKIKTLQEKVRQSKKLAAATKTLRETALELTALSPNLPDQVENVIVTLEEPGHLADFLAANLDVDLAEKQRLLEQLDVAKRIATVQRLLSRQLEMARLQQKIHEDVQSTITDTQRRAYLREQVKAIQKELGEGDDAASEQIAELRRKLDDADPPQKVLAEAERDLRRLETIHPASPEYSVILTYLETVAELPWKRTSPDNLDLDRAREILDRDHYDLDKVKRRLIEYLAVRKLNPAGRGPILCFVGPPGVGKTSLGQSIADALGRTFSRLSFGGIRDEAEIRGHRRTYIGAMPGRIIQEIRRTGTRNPVMMLDEIDKIGADFRGDPASALLEVLDPRQNQAFVDRYLDVPFDLSQVIFIATANYMDPVPPALRDRMEVIEIPGYTDEDKLHIARTYLVPRQMKENGLTTRHARFNVTALRKIIADYTREAGVRELERRIGAVCRGVAAEVAVGPDSTTDHKPIAINPERVREVLGPERYVREVAQRVSVPGVVTGLAYTPVGGEVLFIEATRYPGKGHLQLTGQIGDVMKESAQAALTLLRSKAEQFDLDPRQFSEYDVHLHVPAGAVPKDGPSAGVAMYTALASLWLDRSVRYDVAMTGEITLRGLVLPIGGVKEKTLAAMRAGIRTVILPSRNEKDMPDVADEARKKLRFIFVESVDDLLKVALDKRHAKR
ncbi:MAG: endopeptidase La [Phycisphaeraceae bacterium]